MVIWRRWTVRLCWKVNGALVGMGRLVVWKSWLRVELVVICGSIENEYVKSRWSVVALSGQCVGFDGSIVASWYLTIGWINM